MKKEDLRQRTMSFALRIVRMFTALPKTTEAQVLGKQVLRSGTSIGANYREAYRARSKNESIAGRTPRLPRRRKNESGTEESRKKKIRSINLKTPVMQA